MRIIDFIYLSTLFFIYISVLPPFMMINILTYIRFPLTVISFCMVYTMIVYTMIVSKKLFLKSMGYGLAVSPLIIVSNNLKH